MSAEKAEKRDNHLDKFLTNYFDKLWTSDFYLDGMSKGLDSMFEMRKQWNKNMETMLSLLQLPNSQMQQKTLHTVNTLLSEWRFENDELKLRIEKLEAEIAELKKANHDSEATDAKKHDSDKKAKNQAK